MGDTFEGVLTWMGHWGAFQSVGHVLCLDPDGNNTGIYICRNSPNDTLKLVFFTVYKVDIHFKNLKENKNNSGKRRQLLRGWVRRKRRWDPMHRLVGVVAEGHGIALLNFSLETGSRSKVDKEERKEKWRTDEKKHWERTV